MKARFTAQFISPLGNGAKATRTITGTMQAEPGTALAVNILGVLMNIINEEKLTGATRLKITASILRPPNRKK